MKLAPVVALGLLTLGAARADEVTLRGNYWRDRNTRVIAPEADFIKELPSGTIVGGGYLLDAITSASVAAGVLADQPFTELRNQIGVQLGQRLGPVTLLGNYRYSTESDYWAHVGGGTVALDLFEKNTTIAASVDYSHADVGRRMGPSMFGIVGHLNSWFLLLNGTQVLSRYLVFEAGLELARLGDGNDPQSYQGNPYRMVVNGGTPQVEKVPRQRDRLSVVGGLRLAIPLRLGWLRSLAFYGKYHFYADDWGVVAHAPELRTYARVGPLELRVTGRYYRQSEAEFWPHDKNGEPLIVPVYATGVSFADPSDPNHCVCFTGDAKLGRSSSMFLELRVGMPLFFLDSPSLPLGRYFGASTLYLSYGHYINDRSFHAQFGDAEVAGLEWIFPL